MQLSAQKLRYEPLRSLSFASILNTYVAVGTRFENPVRLLKVLNLTDSDLKISFDGITDEDAIPASGYHIYDYCSDKSDQAGNLEQEAGTQFYVKYIDSAPTVKSVYVTVMYASTK